MSNQGDKVLSMRRFFCALSFLTIVPTPRTYRLEGEDLGKSTLCFPIVGILVGLFTWAVGYLFYCVVPRQVAALGIVVVLAGASGALHLDGLADTCDGLFSGRPRDKVLAIMRDSRLGTMGAVGIIFLVLIKWISLANLAGAALWATVVLMPLCGRTSLLVMMVLLPYARPGGGLATVFQGHKELKWSGLAMGAVLMIAVSILGFGKLGVIIVASLFGYMLVFSGYCYKRIGGYTGDTLGAVCEVSEMLCPLIVLIVVQGNPGL